MSALPSLAMLEGDICDLAEMAELAAYYVNDVLTTMEKHKVNGLVPLGEQEEKLILFCANQLELRAGRLRRAFYEKLEERDEA